MEPVITIKKLNKIYEGGFQALRDVDLEIFPGEIFALLGPNGAGKTSLINIICGINNKTSGSIQVGGYDINDQFREARSLIGLVPQELTSDAFETVWKVVNFSRGLFGLKPQESFIEKILHDLSLWDKRDQKLMTLSGGMKRRVMIAKALAHEPRILFLDEPTAGVDVALRKGMWKLVKELRQSGVTIILTTHYIDEAEEMADRVGVINNGKLILVEDKEKLVKKWGMKHMIVDLVEPVDSLELLPDPLAQLKNLKIHQRQLIYTYDTGSADQQHITFLFEQLRMCGIEIRDLSTKQSTLEEIFVELVGQKK